MKKASLLSNSFSDLPVRPSFYALSFFLSFGLFLFIPQWGNAQSFDSSSGGSSNLSLPAQISDLQEQVSVDISPQIPKPGDQVTLTVSAYGTNIDQAALTWKVDGVTKLSGTGQKTFTLTLGPVGTSNKVDLSIQPTGGGPLIAKTYVFSPGSIDLLWEANTYTPPFYRGKALFTPQSTITFVAIPDLVTSAGSRVPPSQAIYTWSVDGTIEGDKSGFGQDTFSYASDILLEPHDFRVEAYAGQDQSAAGAGTVTLTPIIPEALTYFSDPLYGTLFNRSVSLQYMTANESTFEVYPFYFTTANKNQGVSYVWNLDGSNINIPNSQNSLTFRKTTKKGTAHISVSLTDADYVLQSANSSFSVVTDQIQ